MKWLKKFEEVKLKLKKVDAEGNPYTVTDKGLSTSKYRDAAFKLNYYGKRKRSDNLSDWADEKDFGIYNLWMVFRGDNHKISATDPRMVGIYYGDSMVNLLDKVDSSEEAEEAVDRWVRADSLNVSPLSITFEFSFRPTKKGGYIPGFSDNRYEGTYRGNKRVFHGRIPTFNITLNLSNWIRGLEDWDSESKYNAELDDDEFTPSSVYSLYEESKSFELYLSKPFLNETTYGIFTDRKSANQFIKYFKSIINDEKIDIKDKIMNILNIVGGGSEDIEEAINVLNDIRINGIYDDDITTGNQVSAWFKSPKKINKL